jgi:tetraacyldisaccharide 4'-kinase
MMRAAASSGPAWWRAARLAVPRVAAVAWLYGLAWRCADDWRMRLGWLRAERAPAPVVVVGNLVAGGAGKTPTVIALVQALRSAGWTPGVISRGHGRTPTTATRGGRPALAGEVGDEPLLIHRAPARRCGWRGGASTGARPVRRPCRGRRADVRRRTATPGLAARRAGHRLRRTRHRQRLPAAGRAAAPADARHVPVNSHVLYNAARPEHALARRAGAARGWPAPCAAAGLVVGRAGHARGLQRCAGRPLLAAAGMAAPQRFFAMLRQPGCSFEPLPLPDHHRFEPLPWPAQTPEVLVTEKDAVKLPRQRRHAHLGRGARLPVARWISPCRGADNRAPCSPGSNRRDPDEHRPPPAGPAGLPGLQGAAAAASRQRDSRPELQLPAPIGWASRSATASRSCWSTRPGQSRRPIARSRAAVGMNFTVLIPARLASTRLPRKPLADIGGLPMIVRVAQQRRPRPVHERVVVAADDAASCRPASDTACEAADAQRPCQRQRPPGRSLHAAGPGRIRHRRQRAGRRTADRPGARQPLRPLLQNTRTAPIEHGRASDRRPAADFPTRTSSRWCSTQQAGAVLQRVRRSRGCAMRRWPAPCPRTRRRCATSACMPTAPASCAAFRRSTPAADRAHEALEQLRVLWHGDRIAVHVSAHAPGAGVDTPADLERVRALFADRLAL